MTILVLKQVNRMQAMYAYAESQAEAEAIWPGEKFTTKELSAEELPAILLLWPKSGQKTLITKRVRSYERI